MPFTSRAQQRFMFARHPELAKEWAAKTDFSHLPERASSPRQRALRSIRAKRHGGK